MLLREPNLIVWWQNTRNVHRATPGGCPPPVTADTAMKCDGTPGFVFQMKQAFNPWDQARLRLGCAFPSRPTLLSTPSIKSSHNEWIIFCSDSWSPEECTERLWMLPEGHHNSKGNGGSYRSYSLCETEQNAHQTRPSPPVKDGPALG